MTDKQTVANLIVSHPWASKVEKTFAKNCAKSRKRTARMALMNTLRNLSRKG